VNQQFITSAFLKDPTDPDARDGDFSRGNVMKQAIAEYAASKVFLRITPPLCVHVDISSGTRTSARFGNAQTFIRRASRCSFNCRKDLSCNRGRIAFIGQSSASC
jgi:hypothetical protein